MSRRHYTLTLHPDKLALHPYRASLHPYTTPLHLLHTGQCVGVRLCEFDDIKAILSYMFMLECACVWCRSVEGIPLIMAYGQHG